MEGFVQGKIKYLLRAEGFTVLIVAVFIYAHFDFSWLTFFIFFFLPDLSFLAYLKGPKVGAISYNLAHSYIGPLLCLLIGFVGSIELFQIITIIWFAHIGFDRALGYGLKYCQGFSYTHLGVLGKEKVANHF